MNHRIRKLWLFLVVILIFSFIVPYASAQDPNAFGYEVSFIGRTYDPAADTTTFTYNVVGTGVRPALSHFDLGIPQCDESLDIVSFSPTNAVQIGEDPTTGIIGIKWDFPLQEDGSQIYAITFAGNVVMGEISTAIKADSVAYVSLPGPACSEAAIDVEKFLSLNGGTTWLDADEGAGPDVTLDSQISFRLTVTNTGSVPLADITLSDSLMDVSSCLIPETLGVGAFFECTLGPVVVVEGAFINTATATATFEETTASDTDSATYYGGDRPSIRLEKLVSNDGNIWVDADGVPGLKVDIGSSIYYQIIATNDGNVPLSNFTLTDDTVDISTCAIPATLEPDNGFTCKLGPFDAIEGQFTNTASVSAVFGDQTLSDVDAANYFGSEDTDDPPIIIIEGPVSAVNGNIIIIFGLEIELDPDSPILAVILIGDIIRIEGDYGDGDIIIVIANNVYFINIEVYVSDDGREAWRDSNDCKNPPPPWAPAHGWRRKCE